jgi:hypothetical protein
MDDLAAAITDSLSRSGDGGMSAALELIDGTRGIPAMSFNNEVTSGIYRAAANDIRFSVADTDHMRWSTANGVQIYDGAGWRDILKGTLGSSDHQIPVWDNTLNIWKPAANASLNYTTGALTCAAFTSTGIDDNATGGTLTLIDDELSFDTGGSNVAFSLYRDITDGWLQFAGGDAKTAGARLRLFGQAGTNPGGVQFWFDASTKTLEYTQSASLWDFQANAITTTGALTCGALTSTGIDDNCTGERLQISDAAISFTNSGSATYTVERNDGSPGKALLQVSGAATRLTLWDGAINHHDIEVNPSDHISFKYNDTEWAYYDYSEGGIYGDFSLVKTRLKWALTTEDLAFMNFVATADADTTSAISTLTTSGATTHHVQVDINGTKAWIAVSTNSPS